MKLTRGFISPELKPNRPARGLAELLAGSAMLALIALAAFLAIRSLAPPAPLPASAPPTEFSAARAASLLTDIAKVPHALGMPAHDAVRDAILKDWRELGLEPAVQAGTFVDGASHYGARVENILVRLPGKKPVPGGALMLATHYDSVETGPGAADDGSGVATLLETARALLAGPRPDRDVIFLVTDAEEMGLDGARVFCGESPLAKDVGLVLNFEARGSTGPVLMFQTSAGNEGLIDAMASTSHPRGFSFAQAVYRRMPNDTDLTVFMKNGMQGMNFAFIGHALDYHTPNDSLSHLDLASLQHDGDYALALARRFGAAGIPARTSQDAVYFSLFGDVFIHYSRTVALIIAGLAALLAAGAIVAGGVRRKIKAGGLLLGVVFFVGSAVTAGGLGFALLAGVRASHGHWLPAGPYQANPFYALALALLGVLMSVVIFGLLRKKAGGLEMACGAGIVWAALGVEAAVALPEASYFVGLPALLLAAATFAWSLRKERTGGNDSETPPPPATALPAAVVITLVAAPVVSLAFQLMFLAPFTAAVIAGCTALMVTAAAPAVESIRKRLGKSLTLAFLALFALCTVAGAVTSRYTGRDPRWVSLTYLMDFDKGQSYWVARARDAGPWLEEIAGGKFKNGHPQPEFVGGPKYFAYREAPVADIAPPEVHRFEDRTEGGERTVRFRIASPRGGQQLVVQCQGEGITSAELEGKPLVLRDASGKGLAFAFMNPGRGGFEFTVKTSSPAPLTVRVRESYAGLPPLAGFALPPAPKTVGLIQTRVDLSVSARTDAAR